MKLAFLFGAGVSIPSGMDNTDELTDKILKGENIVRLTGKYDYVDDPEKFNYIWENEYLTRIKKLFHILHNNMGNHYSFINKAMNYEDYYYMFDSMHSDQNMEFENPLVEYFSDYLFKVHTSLFEPLCDLYSPLSLIDLMGEAKNYIKDLITYYLNKKTENLSQFNFIGDINNDENLSQVYLFTLNHDTLLEQYLRTSNIKYSDGFVQKNDTIKMWDPESYREKINLFKLHGSIDWSYSLSDDPYEKKVCIYLTSPLDKPETAILIGSFNKLPAYSKGINFDLQCLFAKHLNECSHLIISGYSFSDQGINSRIINWLYGSRDRKIVVIHKNEEELFQNARPAIRTIRHSDITERTNLFRILPKWIQESSWQEIIELIH